MRWRTAFVDLIGWAAIILWLALSYYFLAAGDGPKFQSVGVVGIAAGIGYFAMQRHSTPHPYGALEIESQFSERIAIASHAGSQALAHATIIAKALVVDAANRGEQPNPVFVALAAIPDEHLKATMNANPYEHSEDQRQILAERLIANDSVIRARRISEFFQAFVVIVATLQSGLGAYFIERIQIGVA